ncbi:MAG: hypothetical protein COZ56_21600 [Armatimonadetes bacterium CG_4_8_14_3_um_filter_58_9]|nr:MAG: hypothetical protein COZ56_21600 [Armatimonadetes bacterium CG_4_8_14_3_um_filter_58_9]
MVTEAASSVTEAQPTDSGGQPTDSGGQPTDSGKRLRLKMPFLSQKSLSEGEKNTKEAEKYQI